MLKISTLFLFLALTIPSFGQQDVTTFRAAKVSVLNRGEERLRAVTSQSIIVLNLRDSVITIEHDQGEVTSFLEYQNEFKILRSMGGSSASVLQFLCEGDFVITFYFRQRMVVVGKRNLNPRQHAIRFEEIQ